MKLSYWFILIIVLCLIFQSSELMLRRVKENSKGVDTEKVKDKFSIVPNSNLL